jgi:hypothetical protein
VRWQLRSPQPIHAPARRLQLAGAQQSQNGSIPSAPSGKIPGV